MANCTQSRTGDSREIARSCYRTIAGGVLRGVRTIESVFYVLPGLYAYGVESLLQFYPREQLLAVSSESLFSGNGTTIVEDFLDIERTTEQLDVVGAAPREQQETMADQQMMIAELRRWYEPHNKFLYELLGQDFGWK